MDYVRLVIRIAAMAATAFIFATMGLRRKKLEAELGTCRLELTRKEMPLFWPSVIMALLFLGVLWFRQFELYMEVVLCAVSVLAAVIVTREKNHSSLSGVYDSALIVDGRLLWKKNITSFPSLHYEKDEDEEEYTDELYRRSLKIVTEDSGIIYVGFADEEEKDAACEILKTWG